AVMPGKSPQRQRLLLTLNESDGTLYVCELFHRDARWNVKPIATVRRPEILRLSFRLAVLALGPIRPIPPQTIVEEVRLSRPVIGNHHTLAVSITFLTNEFTAFEAIDAAKHRFIGDLARDPRRFQSGIVARARRLALMGRCPFY